MHVLSIIPHSTPTFSLQPLSNENTQGQKHNTLRAKAKPFEEDTPSHGIVLLPLPLSAGREAADQPRSATNNSVPAISAQSCERAENRAGAVKKEWGWWMLDAYIGPQ